jgi:flavin reductase (DIM6/NTAB) family NADH-FMN oxidoreductase RutF
MIAMAANLNRLEAKAPPAHVLREATDGAVRDAMRQLAGGVSVVTSGSGQERAGVTVTSIASLSADPPTLLVCVDRASSSYRAILSHGRFAVNVLAADQREIADRFAGGSELKGEDRFREGRWLALPGGAPYLADSVGVFDCEADERIERHTHAIVIGRIRRVLIGDGSGALVRWRGAYDQVGWSRDEIARAVGLSP